MKVQITKEAKKWLTLAEMPTARKIIAECKKMNAFKIMSKWRLVYCIVDI